ncbi:MAG TPA: hypothetical protein PLH39_08590 [Promineifilum sp.]|nr:hypothetical protein [Promineifilum sp.]
MGRQWRKTMAMAVLILGLAMFASSAAAEGLKWSRLGFLQGVAGRQPAVVALAAHPTDPNVLYAGTWLTVPDTALVYRSRDGGKTWQPAAGGLPTDMPANTGVADLILDPQHPNVLYVALQRHGVWRSDDGGDSWSNAAGGVLAEDEDVVALAIAPGAPSVVYALSADGVHVLDGGAWKAKSRGLPARNIVYNDIALDPTDADTLYIATSPTGLYRTTNAGRQWRASNNNLPGANQNVKEITVTPSGEVFISLRGVGLLRSDDKGSTWSPAGEGISYTTTLTGTVSAPVFDPADAIVAYVHNSDGVFRSADGGATWSRFADGLSVTAVVMDMIFAPARQHFVVAGTAASGVWAAYDHPVDPPDPPDPPARLLFMPMIRR